MIAPLLMVAGGLLAVLSLALLSEEDEGGPVPVNEPDIPPAQVTPGSTKYRKIDAILPQLRAAALRSNIPLGLMIGWIARESAGKLDSHPPPLKGEPDGERGYFQLTPSESSKLGLIHSRLSTDSDYSIDAGVKLIQDYMNAVDRLNVASAGSTFYWMLVKLGHTMGRGALQKIVAAAQAAGAVGSWATLEDYALSHEKELLSATKHSPTKWFPLVDKVYEIGAPFGFGTGGQTLVAGGQGALTDIPDPLDALKGR